MAGADESVTGAGGELARDQGATLGGGTGGVAVSAAGWFSYSVCLAASRLLRRACLSAVAVYVAS